jgi:hypothetical protein
MIEKHPGFSLIVGTAAQPKAPDAYYWHAYGPKDEQGMATRVSGHAPTRKDADQAARAARSKLNQL